MVRLTCPRCATTFEPSPGVAPQCPSCGYSPGAPQATAPPPSAPPTYAYPGQPPAAQTWTPAPGAAPPQQMTGTNGMAIGSLICGLVGLCFWPLGIVAIILGFMAKSQIRQTGEKGDGMATAGIVLGFVFVAILIIFVLFYAWVFAAFF